MSSLEQGIEKQKYTVALARAVAMIGPTKRVAVQVFPPTMTRPAPSLPPPSKKRKIQKDSQFAKSVQVLEEQLTSAAAANASLNPLADLLDLTFAAGDAQDTSKAIYALYRVFVVIISGGKLGAGGDEASKVVKAWIWDRLNSYVDFLCGLLKDEEKLLRVLLSFRSSYSLLILSLSRYRHCRSYSASKNIYRVSTSFSLSCQILNSTSQISERSFQACCYSSLLDVERKAARAYSIPTFFTCSTRRSLVSGMMCGGFSFARLGTFFP